MDTREKILNAARDEFAEHGLAGGRVDQIAARAAVNKAMIYYHFQSKENLYQSVIDSHFKSVGEFIQSATTEESDPEKFIYKLSVFLNSMIHERPAIVPILIREIAQGGTRIRAALEAVLVQTGMTVKLKKMIDDGIASGKFRATDSRHVILSFIGMNLVYMILAPVFNSVWEIDDVENFRKDRPAQVVDLFFNGLKAR